MLVATYDFWGYYNITFLGGGGTRSSADDPQGRS